ncbi:hypothetical protein Pmani_021630 [Petrolisthes manimaculis]|uniref:Uncharacterized protein n=1 Tax=Petrolisthes manimaculis TaxID=1843537 RepID=A0AAE1PFR7_9EUCA|nr:hypothetical protein Pmani_021630 [Petrolisthes manimaculis]
MKRGSGGRGRRWVMKGWKGDGREDEIADKEEKRDGTGDEEREWRRNEMADEGKRESGTGDGERGWDGRDEELR